MESSNSINNFQDYITKLFTPSCIVYSTEEVKKSIQKNNLSPAEFLRPFGNFTGYNINFSFADKFTTNIKNFRLDFHDSNKFTSYDSFKFNESLELVIAYNAPDWDYKQLNLTNRAYLELFKKKLKNFSTPWFEEYERLICETLKFNVYEMYEQPLANIYIASANDEVDTIDMLKKKNLPSLISENILENRVATMILLLNDVSEKRISNEKLINKINIIKNKNPRSFVMFLDINSQNPDDTESKLEDIWLPFLHKSDIYNSNFLNCDRGKLISLNEREIFKTSIYNFFDDNVKIYLQKLMLDLDEEVSNNKKGIKNGFLSIFKKSEKPEFIRFEGKEVYKLTSIEKKIYLLSIIQFYLRDYENCIDNLRLLQNDLKNKSPEHYYSVSEFLNIAKFLNGKRDIEFDSIYLAYKKQSYKHSFRYLMVYIRMLETSKKFNEITKILVKYVNEIPIVYVIPFLLEKVSICYLYSSPVNIRKFCLYQALTGMTFRNIKTDMKKYVLNNFGNVIKFFLKNTPSFNKIKEQLNLNIAEICLNTNKFDGGQIFFRNYLELSANKVTDQEQDYIINHYLKCISSHNASKVETIAYVPLSYFSIPEVVNTSLIIIHEQDQENCIGRNWRNFKQFSKVKERVWANLTENDLDVIVNLDNIIEGKQNFTNMQSKRVFKCCTNNKIIVKFLIKNPLNLILNISKLKLICDFIPKEQNNSTHPNNINEIITDECLIFDEKSVSLDRFEEKMIDLCCIPKAPGKLIIKGLEIGLFKMALFSHSFYEKIPNELYKQKDNYVKAKPKDICYEVTDEKQDISIKFSSKDITLYKNELYFLKIKIENNSFAKLKRYSVFFDDHENNLHLKQENCNVNNSGKINKRRSSNKFISNTSSSNFHNSHTHFTSSDNQSQTNNMHSLSHHNENSQIGNVAIFKYFHREIDINKNESNEIAIPLCPQNEGEYKLKVLVKFEEESKFKEIEIRRFVLKVKVLPSVNLNYTQEILNFNRTLIDLNLNLNYQLFNTMDLKNLIIGKIFTNEFLRKADQNNEWLNLSNQKFSKLYSKVRLLYDMEAEKNKQELLAIEEKKAKKLSRIILTEKNLFENIDINTQDLYIFDFLLFYCEENIINGNKICPIENLFANDNVNLINNEKSLTSTIRQEFNKINLVSLLEISLKFKELLNKKKNVFISYSITDKNSSVRFQGLNILGLNIAPSNLNYKNIKNIIREITEVEITNEKIYSEVDDSIEELNKKMDITSFFANEESLLVKNKNENSYTSLVTIKMKMKNLFDHLEINSYEIFISDDDNEFDWFGVKKYKLKDEGNKDKDKKNEFIHEFDFNFSTGKKGLINVNRININIVPISSADKVITINSIPRPIVIDL